MTEDIAEQLAGKRVAFALTGSYCTLGRVVPIMRLLRELGCSILPVVSFAVRDQDSRFGAAAFWRAEIARAAGVAEEDIVDTIAKAEPIGPQMLTDILLIAPCTGNTTAKLAHAVTDTPVLMAAKSHLRGQKPLVLAIATNDGLAANARNIGHLLNVKHVYFVPFGQDDAVKKPNSLVAEMERIPATLSAALQGRQLQPLLLR